MMVSLIVYGTSRRRRAHTAGCLHFLAFFGFRLPRSRPNHIADFYRVFGTWPPKMQIIFLRRMSRINKAHSFFPTETQSFLSTEIGEVDGLNQKPARLG